MNMQNTGRIDAYFETFTLYSAEDMDGQLGGNPRSEKSGAHKPLQYCVDSDVSFNLNLPDWPNLPKWAINFQAHANPDDGESGRSPPLALESHKHEFRVQIRFDDGRETITTVIPFSERSHWRFQIAFSPDENGMTKVWKDGELVVDYTGPNCYDDEEPPYYKWGIHTSSQIPAYYGKLTAQFDSLEGFY